jgi:hypothetical protein
MTQAYTVHQSLAEVASAFVTFADSRCQGQFGSALYEFLSRRIAQDEELLHLAAHAPRRPVPQLFLGAVHYLLLQDVQHPLAAYYPSVKFADALPLDEPALYPTFRQYCLDRANSIMELLATRIVQTNHVTRSSALLPAFTYVAQRAGNAPISEIEIGASAGFNLSWDNYRYCYRNTNGFMREIGSDNALLSIDCLVHGDILPPLVEPLPKVVYRVGIDLHPIDVHNRDEVLWLRALIWPERLEYVEFLTQAVSIAQTQELNMIDGDAVEELPSTLQALNTIAHDSTWCVLSSYMLFQLPDDARERLESILASASKRRVIFWLSLEWYDTQSPSLLLFTFDNGALAQREMLARCCGQGDWIEWLVPA